LPEFARTPQYDFAKKTELQSKNQNGTTRDVLQSPIQIAILISLRIEKFEEFKRKRMLDRSRINQRSQRTLSGNIERLLSSFLQRRIKHQVMSALFLPMEDAFIN